MADFKTKLFTLAGIATMFAGFAHGQTTITSETGSGFIRAEGLTEMLPTQTINLTTAPTGNLNLEVYLPVGTTITSQSTGTSPNIVSETTATANNGGGTVNGVVSGNTVTFSGITTTGATNTITVANIRVNATVFPPSTSGLPTGISEQLFLSGAGANTSSITAQNVAYVQSGLGAYSIPSSGAGAAATNFLCNAVSGSTLQETVNVAEGFYQSFKTKAGETGGSADAATSGTRIAVTLANLPSSGVAVYLPITVDTSSTGGTGVLQMVTSPTAAETLATASTATGAPAGTAALTIANGSGTVYYELTTATAPSVIESFPINVYYVAKSGALTTPQTASTVSVSFAPINSTSNYPDFVIGSSTTTVTGGSTFQACTTTILFPYVVNTAGFDTGLAISNTSSDNLGTGGKSVATAQSGTCTLTFYQATGAPAAYTTPSVGAGTTWANAASVIASGADGYMIASCNFLYGHGFAYITYDLTLNNGAAMGYLADVIPANRASSLTTITPTFTANALTGLTTSNTVSANNPESWGH